MPETSDDQNRNQDQLLIEQIRDRFREVESLIESMKSKLPDGEKEKDL